MEPEYVPSSNWHSASVCGGDGCCVEVAALPQGGAAVRDSKDPQGAELHFSAAEWAAFIAGVKNGEFDLRPAD